MSDIKHHLKSMWLGWFFMLALLVWLAYYLLNNLEYVEVERDLGWQREARKNPFKALQLFLESTGFQVQSSQGLHRIDKLPLSSGTLFITSSRQFLSERQNLLLRQWIQQGGHLVTTAQLLYDANSAQSGDYLLDYVGVQTYLAEEQGNAGVLYGDESDEEDPELGKLLLKRSLSDCSSLKRGSQDAVCEKMAETRLSKVIFGVPEDPILVAFNTSYHLYDSTRQAVASAGSDRGVHLLQYQLERGLLTVITDDSIWRNTRVNLFDHAYFMWLLMGSSNELTIKYDVRTPFWLISFWKTAWPLVVTGLFVFLLWAVARAYRFGPIIQVRRERRRRLMEHIEMNGRFLWRHRRARVLIQSLRDNVHQKACHRFRRFELLDHEDQIHYLSEMTGLDTGLVEKALTGKDIEEEVGFFELTRYLQQIGNHL